MNFKHELAIAAFTEAIGLDPDAPNPYIGRAMAHRRLGHDDAAAADEERARELGGPERNAWERLCNRSRRRWHGDFDDPAWQQADPLSRSAVLLDVLNAQILNGGLHQWVANGYARWINDVIAAATAIGSPATRQVAAILTELATHLGPEPPNAGEWIEEDPGLADDYDDLEGELALELLTELDDRYHQVQMQFVKDVRQWFESQAPPVE
jgi:hypothetical protein